MNTPATSQVGRGGSMLCVAVRKCLRMDGVAWATAFSFHAFFLLFPLMILLVITPSEETQQTQ